MRRYSAALFSSGGFARHPVAHARPGLTMIEIIVAVAILAILTAAIAPTLLGVVDHKRIEASAESIEALTDAMSTMRDDNQDWPGRLSHLSTPITTSDLNICGVPYASGKVAQWAGPYIDRVVASTGVPLAIGTVSDLLVREIVSGNDGYLKVEVTGVTPDDALALDEYTDGDGSSTEGAVRWDEGAISPDGLVTVYYLRPIRGC